MGRSRFRADSTQSVGTCVPTRSVGTSGAVPWGASSVHEVWPRKAAMYYGLYMSAAGAHAQSQHVEILSNNLANSDTVGFKRELTLLEARDSEAIERGLDYRGSRGMNDVGGGIRLAATATDFRVGKFRQTGNQTDFALETPDGFFGVQRGRDQLLTRAGDFRLDVDGNLVTQEGDAVLGSDSSPIQLDPQIPWRVLPGGLIQQAGDTTELGI